jgi:hypothetical protein
MNIFKKIFDFLLKTTPKEDTEKINEKYIKYLEQKFSENSRDLIGNFSFDGYYNIFILLITNAKNKITIVCKDYETLFNDNLFLLLSTKAKTMKDSNFEISIITYNGEMEDSFKKLSEQNKNVFYYPVKAVKCINNFILADENKYWIEDTIFQRNNLNDSGKLKAVACFNDMMKVAKLNLLVNKIKIISEEKEE